MQNTLAGGTRRRSLTAFVLAVALSTLGAVGVVLWPAGPALAHNQLVSAKPDRDAVLREAPTAVTLAFLQRLDPDATTVVVSDDEQRPVPASAPTIKAKTVTVALDQPLGNGAYKVAYSVVSVDGHPVKGSYSFTVADPSATAPSAAPAAPAAGADPVAPTAEASRIAAAAPDDSDTGVPLGLVGFGGLGALVAVGAAYLYVAKRRRAGAART